MDRYALSRAAGGATRLNASCLSCLLASGQKISLLPLSEDEPYVYQVVNPEYEDELTQTWCELEDMDLGEGSHRPSAQGAGGEVRHSQLTLSVGALSGFFLGCRGQEWI